MIEETVTSDLRVGNVIHEHKVHPNGHWISPVSPFTITDIVRSRGGQLKAVMYESSGGTPGQFWGPGEFDYPVRVERAGAVPTIVLSNLQPEQLLPGDEILSWTFTKWKPVQLCRANRKYVVRTAYPKRIICDDCSFFWSYAPNDDIVLEVRRANSALTRTQQRSSGSSVSPPRHIPDFPDLCTRCGQPAYIGLFEVAHKDEERATGCPARRK